MIERFHFLVLAVILAVPALSCAQSASEELISSHYLAKLQDYSSRRAVLDTSETGLADRDADRAAAVASRAVRDCFLRELEVIALTNSIDKHIFMDALAFSIVWRSESEFFQSFQGVEHLGNAAMQCVESGFKSQGIRLKGS